MNKDVIKTAQLCKTYHSEGMDTEVLRGISLEIGQGEFCAIMGESGSGKSTLLQILGTLDTLSSGYLEIMGEDASTLSGREKAALRRKTIGFVFQSFYLIPGLTVYENVMMPRLLDRQNADPSNLYSLLETVGLIHRKDHRPSQLSGGEQQRAAIARALANHPGILLADEPTGNLDTKNSKQIISLLHRINRENHVTIVMVTHSIELAQQCGRIFHIQDGVLL